MAVARNTSRAADAAPDSPHASQTRSRLQIPMVAGSVGTHRAWPHKAHISAQYVEQLRQLAKARVAQHMIEACNSQIARSLLPCSRDGAKFVGGEDFALEADPRLGSD